MCIWYGDCPFNTFDCEENNPHYKCKHRVIGEMVRIRYWRQDKIDSGRWCLTGLMKPDIAKEIVQSTIIKRPKIVCDSEYMSNSEIENE